MHAVVGLWEKHGVRPICHFVGDFVTTMGGQAVHYDHTRVGFCHQAMH